MPCSCPFCNQQKVLIAYLVLMAGKREQMRTRVKNLLEFEHKVGHEIDTLNSQLAMAIKAIDDIRAMPNTPAWYEQRKMWYNVKRCTMERLCTRVNEEVLAIQERNQLESELKIVNDHINVLVARLGLFVMVANIINPN